MKWLYLKDEIFSSEGFVSFQKMDNGDEDFYIIGLDQDEERYEWDYGSDENLRNSDFENLWDWLSE